MTAVGPAPFPASKPTPGSRPPYAPSPALRPLKEDEGYSPLRSATCLVGVALVFLRISMFHQIQATTMGVNLKLLYVVTIPAVLGVIVGGGFRRAFSGRPTYYFVGYAVWMCLSIPFSSWRGSSLVEVLTYLRTEFIILFVVAGLTVTWGEFKVVLRAMAAGSIVMLLAAVLFSNDRWGYREGLDFGTIANPNDLAGHVLFALPFVLWLALTARNAVVRLASLAAVGYGLKVILGTASRGALVGVFFAFAYFLWRGTSRQRIAIVLLAPIAALLMTVLLPQSTLRRLFTFTETEVQINSAEEVEAMQSEEARRYLLKKSIEYMFQFPIFGVGIGQFPSYEGKNNAVFGTHGYWHNTHNSYTQAAVEGGIPAGLLLLAGVLSSLALVNKCYRDAVKRQDCQDLRSAAICMSMSFVSMAVAITFLNFAYFFYMPLMGGLAVAFRRATESELRKRDAAASGARLQTAPTVGSGPGRMVRSSR